MWFTKVNLKHFTYCSSTDFLFKEILREKETFGTTENKEMKTNFNLT